MGLKRKLGDEGSDNLLISNNSQNLTTKFRKAVNYVKKENSLQEIATQVSAMLEPAIRRAVKEEVEQLIFYLKSSPRNSLFLQQDSYPSRSLQLHFVNELPSTLFTNSYVEDVNHAPLQIKLVDARSKSVIQHGPFSCMKVEIFVLNGDFPTEGREDWSESEVNENIVRAREGKRPLLVRLGGELSFSLVGGVGSIRNITFTDNSSWVRSRKFKLGVRVLSRTSSGTGVREAVSEAFVVLDHRGESYQKHNTPSLDDPVWRLRKIAKQGASHMRLESKGIKTVKDFLIYYHLYPSHLRNVLGKGVPNRTWDTMVKHANECQLDNTYYSYCNTADGTQLLFNCVYKVVAVKFEGLHFQPIDTLDMCQKGLVEKLKQSAYSNVNQLVPVINPLATSTSMQPTTEQYVPVSTSMLNLQHDACSFVDQGEPEKQLDINISESGSYPCTLEDGYLLEDDSTSQTNQPMQGFTPSSLLMDDPPAELSNGVYNWYQTNSIATSYAQNSEFGELCHLETSPFCPLASYWGLGDGFLTTSTPAHVGIISQLPDFSVGTSGRGKSKAGWCKIRAAVMWKIVRRNAAARKKAEFPFSFC